MSEYTPTTEHVREDFAFPWSPEHIGDRPARVAAFDRWLAEHDRLVAERAWAACVDHLEAVLGGEIKRAAHADNPYRKEQENNDA